MSAKTPTTNPNFPSKTGQPSGPNRGNNPPKIPKSPKVNPTVPTKKKQ